MAEKKEKVLIVHNYYQIPGGEDMVVTNEKKMLEDHGHEVILYTRDNAELKQISKTKKIILPFIAVFNIKTYIDIKRIIREQKIDIVHVHNTLVLVSPSVYYAALSMKVPVVQTIHNFRLLCPGATFYRDGHICEDCVTKGLRCAVRHSCYRKSKLQTIICVISTKLHRILGVYEKIDYICLTEFNKEKFLCLDQIREEHVYVKPNFVGYEGGFIPGEEREDLFLYAGRLDKLKGIQLLLKAWKQMGEKAPRLVICGTGPMEDTCRRFIEENKLNIEMLGFVPNVEIKKLMATSKALILPTQWYEGFPISIVEAFSVGTPVICSDIGNVGSIVSEGMTGTKFKATSEDDLIRAVIRIVGYPNIHKTTYCTFLKRYSTQTNYFRLINIYKDVMMDGSI